jgi:hypothetical protein
VQIQTHTQTRTHTDKAEQWEKVSDRESIDQSLQIKVCVNTDLIKVLLLERNWAREGSQTKPKPNFFPYDPGLGKGEHDTWQNAFLEQL